MEISHSQSLEYAGATHFFYALTTDWLKQGEPQKQGNGITNTWWLESKIPLRITMIHTYTSSDTLQ
jgi:hypothetical protein